MNYTNQQTYAETGIQVDDIKAIAAKFDYAQPYSREQVEVMRSIAVAAKNAGVKIKRFVENVVPETAPESHPEQGHYQSAVTITPEVFQASLATVADSLVQQSEAMYSRIDAHCTDQEEALATAVVDRFKESPLRAMALTAEKLGHSSPTFFPLAPEGAELKGFRRTNFTFATQTQQLLSQQVDAHAETIEPQE